MGAKCEGCLGPLPQLDLIQGYRVCFACTQARQRAAMTHTCGCGRQRRESELHELYPGQDIGRKWYTCLRCLGTTRQVA